MANGTMLTTALYVVLIGVLFYVLLIRPQKKQQKTHDNMINALNVGDEIYTAGGIIGQVTRIKEKTIWLRVSEKTEIELLKSSIAGLKAYSDDDF